MTENEAIEEVRFNMSRIGLKESSAKRVTEAREVAIQALEEIQAYRAIGTIEEFKDLKEKSEPKNPITYTHTHRADCPNCRATVRGIDKPFGDYCSKCGIKLNWSE